MALKLTALSDTSVGDLVLRSAGEGLGLCCAITPNTMVVLTVTQGMTTSLLTQKI